MAVSDQDFALLQEEVRNLRRRMESLLSRAGGFVDGNVAFSGDLEPVRSGTQYIGYLFVPLGIALSSNQWDATPKTTADSGTIDLSTEFGLPSGIRAIAFTMYFQDGTVNVRARLSSDSAPTNVIQQSTQVADQRISVSSICPCDENGDVYFSCTGDLDEVTIRIFGYFI